MANPFFIAGRERQQGGLGKPRVREVFSGRLHRPTLAKTIGG